MTACLFVAHAPISGNRLEEQHKYQKDHRDATYSTAQAPSNSAHQAKKESLSGRGKVKRNLSGSNMAVNTKACSPNSFLLRCLLLGFHLFTNNMTKHEAELWNEVVKNTSYPCPAQLIFYIISLPLSLPFVFWKDTTTKKRKKRTCYATETIRKGDP